MEQPYQSPQAFASAHAPVADIGRIVCQVEDSAKDKYQLTAYNGDREHRKASYTHHREEQDRSVLFMIAVEVLIHDLPYNEFKVVPACERAGKEVAAHVSKSVELKTLEGKTIRISA